MLAPAAFQRNYNQQQTGLFFLEQEAISVAITNYGARLVQVLVSAKMGPQINVALGYPSLQGYLEQPENYMGAINGRCANRIAGAAFDINKRHYQLSPNEGHNLLHSGPDGLHSRVWQVGPPQNPVRNWPGSIIHTVEVLKK